MNENAMQVVMATAWYPPYDLGGTEVYLEGLVDELARCGHACTVLVPRAPGAPAQYEHHGVQVRTYPVPAEPAPGEISRQLPHLGFDEFCQELARHERAIYHQHSWTRGCGLEHLRAAHALGLRTVLTIHVAGAVCLRGTLLHFGEEACDGLIEQTRCGACWAQSRGAPRPVAWALARLPVALTAPALRLRTKPTTALAAGVLAERKAEDLREAFDRSGRVVAVCQWLSEVLIINGVPREKLVVSRHGLATAYLEQARSMASKARPAERVLKLAYLGRWDRLKGVHVAVAAIRSLPAQLGVSLTVYAIDASEDDGYQAQVMALAADDPRISFEPCAPHQAVAATLARHDALVVPSLWLETGPLVVLEAQAVGLFILGSRLGGIVELVDGSGAGELIEPGNVQLWANAIARLAALKSAGPLPKFSGRLRTQADVAADMLGLYRDLWSARQ